MRILSIALGILVLSITSCSSNRRQTDEQIRVNPVEEEPTENDSLVNSILGNVTMKQVASFPNNVILTGMNEHRLVSVYKSRIPQNKENSSLFRKASYYSESAGDETYEHYMPGIDVLFGYNLLNIAHYDMKGEKMNFLFTHPVLVKTLYYPSFTQDSLDNQPINRNYYLVSVYDDDTNKDTLINKKDLRHFYLFDASGSVKTQLIPGDHSVMRSEYDSKNDVMYVFARHDENKNGMQEPQETIHIFWFSLKEPAKAKLLY